MWLYRKILLSKWEWLQRAVTIQNDGFYTRYKVFGITVAKHEAVRFQMFGKYKVAHLLGITREHEKQFRHVEIELTKQGYICFAPAIYCFETYKQYPDLLDDMCYEKLLVCDLCVVVTPEHIGKSTSNRIRQAISMNKPVYVWENDGLTKTIKSEEDLLNYIGKK